METQLLIDNLTNPALMFFFLGMLAVRLKSDLEIPSNSSKFISLYLLFSIGFKGGQELAHSALDAEIFWSLLFGVIMALVVPVYSFFKKKQSGILNVLINPCLDAALWYNARFRTYGIAILEHKHRWNTSDSIVCGSLLVLINIEFDNLDFSRVFYGNFFQSWL